MSLEEFAKLPARLIETASFLEEVLSWDWCTRDKNPRNSSIAALRWEIRCRTGRPHDPQLAALIDAALRAAGSNPSAYFEPAVLDRIERREKEGRVKATARFHSRVKSDALPRLNT